jgi:hypothetical protein
MQNFQKRDKRGMLRQRQRIEGRRREGEGEGEGGAKRGHRGRKRDVCLVTPL